VREDGFVERTSLRQLPKGGRTAVIVAVPEVEPVVGRYRWTMDRAAGWGVPAHVTVVYPFVPADDLDQATVDAVAAAVATVPVFDCVFARVEWFTDQVVWLAPEPDLPFRALTRAVEQRFPDHPPYGGAYPDPIPHLTVGEADLDGMRAAAREMALPIPASVTQALLIAGTHAPGSWRLVAELALKAEPA
jgi:hypothetical protein